MLDAGHVLEDWSALSGRFLSRIIKSQLIIDGVSGVGIVFWLVAVVPWL